MFFTVKLKKAWLFIIIGVIILLAITLFPKGDSASRGADLLRSLGYQVAEPPTESLKVTLPEREDPVFEGYNALQRESGFDLTPYAGEEVHRLTYQITAEEKPFLANLLFWNGRLIGGDICTVNLDGEMYPLGEQNEN